MLLDNIHCETLPPINNTCGESSQGQVDHGGRVCGGVTGRGVVGWTNTISEVNSLVEKRSSYVSISWILIGIKIRTKRC